MWAAAGAASPAASALRPTVASGSQPGLAPVLAAIGPVQSLCLAQLGPSRRLRLCRRSFKNPPAVTSLSETYSGVVG